MKKAQDLLVKGLNTTAGYQKFRATRGAAAALLGHLYMYKEDYAKAAAEYKKLLPGVGDSAYGSYSLVDDYRDNFTVEGENNKESIFEVQYDDFSTANKCSQFLQNWTLNRTSFSTQWWNFAVPVFKLDEFESWEETINGASTKVYDYRVYETFWGVPNGANFTEGGVTRDWIAQKWDEEKIAGDGAYGIRKMAIDNDADQPSRGPLVSEVNWRLIRLADVMSLYAECLANINPGNLDAASPESAVYWIDKIRERANQPMDDQAHLYSARPGVYGKLPSVLDLMASKGWSLMRAIERERYVEGYCEGWNKEDLKRWEKGPDYVPLKSGWKGYESLTLPVPLPEVQNNPGNM